MKNRLSRTQILGDPNKCWQRMRGKKQELKGALLLSQFCMENLTFMLFSDKKQSFTLKAYSAPSRVWKKGGEEEEEVEEQEVFGGCQKDQPFASSYLSVLRFLLLFYHLLVLFTALLLWPLPSNPHLTQPPLLSLTLSPFFSLSLVIPLRAYVKI